MATAPPDEPALAALKSRGRQRRLGARQTIFAREEPGDFLAIIGSGAVRISVFNPDGRELALALIGPGEVLGEIAVLDQRPRTADAIAVGAVEACVVAAKDVRKLLRNDPDVAGFFVRLLCQRLRGANTSAEAHALGSLSGRLALQLVNLGHEDRGLWSSPTRPRRRNSPGWWADRARASTGISAHGRSRA